RGPDYQFAGAAAVLLRVLGYPTRLVSGFYAAPGRYDPQTGHTPVVQDDLHFWAEVRLPPGDWLVVEPAPGYEVLGPSPSGPARLRSRLPDPELDELTRMAEWAAYAPDLAPAWGEAEVRGTCRRVLDGWTLRRWRRVVAGGVPCGGK